MKLLIVLLCLFTLCLSNYTSKRVSIEVYYEALCGDSINFITKQLARAKKIFKKKLHVVFVPYGNAKTIATADGGYKFECQHGEGECSGNMYQACLIDKVNGTSDEDKLVDVISCVMGDPHRDNAVIGCMTQLKLQTSASSVEDCKGSRKGQELLEAYGEITDALTPKQTFIPWFTFNEVFNQEAYDEGMVDLKESLCKHFFGDSELCKK